MKRIAAILTSLVLVFSLAACGSQQAGTAAGSEAASTARVKQPPPPAVKQPPPHRPKPRSSFWQRKTIF